MATTLVMGQEKCSDLVLSSLVRSRLGELIASKVDHGKSDLFLVGMLSLMDAILEVPMGGVVEGLAFDPDARAELLGAKKGSQTPLTPQSISSCWRERLANGKRLQHWPRNSICRSPS